MNLEQMEQALTTPDSCPAFMDDWAILRLWTSYEFIQYSRKELKEVFQHLKTRIMLIEAGIEGPTATDRFLMTVLMAMTGQLKS